MPRFLDPFDQIWNNGTSPGDGAGASSLAEVTCTGATGTQPAICNGLVALLHFDNELALGETATLARDVSGRGNDATCTAPDCPTWNPVGRFGGAFSYTQPDAFSIAERPVGVDHRGGHDVGLVLPERPQ